MQSNNPKILSQESSAPPKLTRRKQQALLTKDKIFQAAMEVINRKGFSNTTIEDITSQAGVASGSFYTYFKSKEAIVLETFRHLDEIYEWAYQQIGNDTFLSTITRFIRLSCSEYEKRGKGIIRAIISNYFSFPEFDFFQPDRSLIRCLQSIVEKGISDGEVNSALTAGEYVTQLLSAMAGVEVLWCFDETGQRLADMMAASIRSMALGMLAK